MKKLIKQKNIIYYLFFTCLSFMILFFISSSTSPFYNVFWGDYAGNLTSGSILIGKSWLKDVLPYRDLFGTSGPLFYFIQAFGYFLGGRTGIFLLQILNISLFLCICHKILGLYTKPMIAAIFTCFLMIPYLAMASSGNSDGEWCLSIIALSLYLLLKSTQNKVFFYKYYFALGLCSGAILMICSRTIGFVLACSLFLIYEMITLDKEHKTTKSLGVYLLGITFVILPFMIYLGSHHALEDFYHSYIRYNLREFLIGSENFNLILRKVIKCTPVWLLLFSGITTVRTQSNRIFLVFSLCFSIFPSAFLFLGQGLWHYYLLTLPLLVAAIAFLFFSLAGKLKIILSICFAVGVTAICLIPAKAFLTYISTTDMTNIEIAAETLKTNMDENEIEDVFVINSPASLYLALDQTPSYKYFAYHKNLMKVDSKIYENMYDYVTQNFKNGLLIYGGTTWMQERIGSYQMITVYSYGHRQHFAVYLYDTSESSESILEHNH